MCRDAASEVVKDDMTPEQKAETIDAWVCSHLKYNYETYGLTKKAVIGVRCHVGNPRDETYGLTKKAVIGGTDELIKNAPGGQSLYGVVTGNTVCMSYAYAFKAIADDAGLESMVVTGTAYGADGTGGPHAWNLVKASDGSWRTVDATWDDEGDSSDKEWLMLDQDKPAFGHRTYDASALVDTNLDTIPGFRSHLEG